MRFIHLSVIPGRDTNGEAAGSRGVLVNTENIESCDPKASSDGETEWTEIRFVSGQVWRVQETIAEIARSAHQEP